MANGYRNIYIERDGKILRTDKRFRDDGHLRASSEDVGKWAGRSMSTHRTWMPGCRRLRGQRHPPALSVHGRPSPIAVLGRPLHHRGPGGHGTLPASPASSWTPACAAASTSWSAAVPAWARHHAQRAVQLIPSNERIITIEDAAE